jgi:hypothetical protein
MHKLTDGKWRGAALVVLVLWLAVSATAAGAAASTGALRVGAARVEITSLVTAELPPTGKYEHEKLYVRAIVIDNGVTRAAILGADSSDMYDSVWERAAPKIARELDCPVANVLMSVTHDHSAGSPMGLNIQETPYMPGLAEAMFNAVRQAKAQLQPALLAFGTGAAYLNVNRDAINPVTHLWTEGPNLHAYSDKTVAVTQFVRPNGELIAAHVTYAMHPVNAFQMRFITADFPGATSRYVEQAFQDKAVIVFAQNASGDQNPLYMRPSTNAQASRYGVGITGYQLDRRSIESKSGDKNVMPKPVDPVQRDRLERFIESEGQILGEEVIRVMSSASGAPSGTVRIRGMQKVITCPARKRLDYVAREGVPATYADAEPLPIRLSALGIGEMVFAGIDAEVYSGIARRIKSQSPLANTVVVTLANGHALTNYIPDEESYGHLTFQILSANLKPGCAEDAIADGLTEMITEYAQR